MTQPAAVPNDKTTLWGVLGIVFFCCPLLGIVFGVLSMMEAKKSGKQPTLAYVAFALAGLVIVVNLILTVTGNGYFGS
ncbi:hypothetical protein Rhe02_24820 [Rhizocola hellebori]|uniref:DUF4190 domain-containing protein n=1 Tax=Rhizocola hellebori TaxID=1392758 RepID=A0A8J3Q7A1_9ACTN|nr:DUF4190 domain-containing protein [Rhizocola hellebori]GIH04415.1 hypothetical protein Rhe02_24820 [Rhizocola hellebori]